MPAHVHAQNMVLSAQDAAFLQDGLVHLTKEAAQAHAEAMLKFTKV